MSRTPLRYRLFLCVSVLAVMAGCATFSDPPDDSPLRFGEIIREYAQSEESLRLEHLTPESSARVGASKAPRDVYIMVHPGYAFFFTMGKKAKTYYGARYQLMELQMKNEARFMAERAKAGDVIVLIVPGNYQDESSAPQAYTAFLNTVQGPSVFYVFSETASNGAISTNDMVTLYRFLHAINTKKVLIGGGYIGRCQREFYFDLTTYFDKNITYFVQEISAISPEDVSSQDALDIITRLQQRDFSPVGEFIEKRCGDGVNVLSITTPAAAP